MAGAGDCEKVVAWQGSGFTCLLAGCSAVWPTEAAARVHVRKGHPLMLRPNQGRTPGGHGCQFCAQDFKSANALNGHTLERHRDGVNAAWAAMYGACGPIEKRGRKTWCHSTSSERPAGLAASASVVAGQAAVGGGVDGDGDSAIHVVDEAVLSAAREAARQIAMTGPEAAAARGAGQVAAAGMDGFWGHGDTSAQTQARWLVVAGMSLTGAMAAEVLQLTTGASDLSVVAKDRDRALVDAAREYLRSTRVKWGQVSGSLRGRIKANAAGIQKLTSSFQLVQNGGSEDKYGGEAARLLRFATRVTGEQAARFGLGGDGQALRAAGALLLEGLGEGPEGRAAVRRHVHTVLGVFASRLHEAWEGDRRHAIWYPALSVCYTTSGVTTRVRDAKLVTPLVAALKYSLKCWAVHEMAEVVSAAEGGGDEGEVADRLALVVAAVNEDEHENSALSVLVRLSRVATAASQNDGTATLVWCTKPGHGFRQCAVVGGHELSIASVARALQASVSSALTLIRRLLLESQVGMGQAVRPGDESWFGGRVARVMAASQDDARTEEVGSGWTTLGSGPSLLRGAEHVVIDRLAALGSGAFDAHMRKPAPGVADLTFDAYMDRVTELHAHLAFWAHSAGGGCPRGTELAQLQVRTTRTLHRSMFLRTSGTVQPQVYFAPSYDKRSARTGNGVTCYRFLPAGLMSEIVFAYVTWIKPFETLMVMARFGGGAARTCCDYLFVDKVGKMRGDAVVRGFVTDTLTAGMEHGSSPPFWALRHWHKAVLSHHVLTGSDASSKLVAATFGHGEHIGGSVYGTTMDVGRTGTAASHEAFRCHADRVHTLFSVGEGEMEGEPAAAVSTGSGGKVSAQGMMVSPPPSADVPMRSPPSGSLATASAMEAVLDLLDKRLPKSKRSWTAGCCSAVGGGIGSATKFARLASTFGASETGASTVSRVVACMRRALKDAKAVPRSGEQMEAILLALASRDDFLVVLPTGMGKSLVYILPALMDSGKVTAVVVPTAALVGNAVAGCVRAGLRAAAAVDCRKEPDVAVEAARHSVVVFSMEALDSEWGQGLLVALSCRRALRQVVLDEAHTLWEWREFRRGARQISRLVRGPEVQVPIVGLTATASPETVRLLAGTVGTWDVVVRASTVRPGIRYSVKTTGSRSEATAATVRLARDAGPCSKCLIFCMTIADCEKVARALAAANVSAVAYHGAMTAADKERADAAFRGTGEEAPAVAVCTAGYGLGIDIPEVTGTVHFGGARSVSAFMQESGRAGRGAGGGGAATSMVVVCREVREAALGSRTGMTSYGEPGSVGAGSAVESDADYRDVEFPGASARVASAAFLAICEQTGECMRMLLHNEVDGGCFGPQICVGIPGAELCHACDAGLQAAEGALSAGAGPAAVGAQDAAKDDVATPVRESAQVMQHRANDDAGIRAAFMAAKTRLGSGNCSVCWVCNDGELVAHDLGACAHVGRRCFDCLGEKCPAGTKMCGTSMRVKSGLCYACGLGTFGGGPVHDDVSVEYGKKRTCTARKMLRAAIAMWRFKKEAVKARFPNLAALDDNQFLVKLVGSGDVSAPLTIRMSVWWAESVRPTPAPASAPAPRGRMVQTGLVVTPNGVGFSRQVPAKMEDTRSAAGGRSGPAPTKRALFPGK
jgi:superfamily II DNA or RNA helicase